MLFPVDKCFLSVVNKDVAISKTGIDIGLPAKTPIIACAEGTIVYAGAPEGWLTNPAAAGDGGLLVVARLDAPVTVAGQSCQIACYKNLSRLEPGVAAGVKVAAGQRLGRSGSDGGTPYLNFSLLSIDGGGVERPLDQARLAEFIWTEVADIGHMLRSR